MTLISFHGNPKIQKKYLARIENHFIADEIVKGKYWEEGKGCAVGCTIHGDDHFKYEVEIGIPVMLAKLEDTLFEGLPNDKAKNFPRQFLLAAGVGKNLTLVGWKFLYWLVSSQIQSNESTVRVLNVLKQLSENGKIDQSEAESAAWSAEYAAWSAADSAESAARSAAWSAYSAARSAADSADSAESAARSAAWSAYSAARSAADSADSAESAAWSAEYAARSAADSAESAESAAYEKMADKLLQLMEEA